TGDLCRSLANGEIEYLGRIDHQVKVRGYRIELGEIEAALATHPDVRQSAVVMREEEGGDQRLVAYVVTEGKEPQADGLRRYLQERLPEYMTPVVYVGLVGLPLSPSGKVDRKALPAPKWRSDRQDEEERQRTPVEEVVAGIWGELLKREEIGVDENFFQV